QAFCDLVARCNGAPIPSCMWSCAAGGPAQPCLECNLAHGCDFRACDYTCSACNPDDGCPSGQACKDYSLCVPRECMTAEDCPCVGVCDGGLCQPPLCLTDGDCGSEARCQEHTCVAMTCNVGTDCRSGVCNASHCDAPSCRTEADCLAPEVC